MSIYLPHTYTFSLNDDTIYFIPAVLDCASQDELTKQDANNPQPLYTSHSPLAIRNNRRNPGTDVRVGGGWCQTNLCEFFCQYFSLFSREKSYAVFVLFMATLAYILYLRALSNLLHYQLSAYTKIWSHNCVPMYTPVKHEWGFSAIVLAPPASMARKGTYNLTDWSLSCACVCTYNVLNKAHNMYVCTVYMWWLLFIMMIKAISAITVGNFKLSKLIYQPNGGGNFISLASCYWCVHPAWVSSRSLFCLSAVTLLMSNCTSLHYRTILWHMQWLTRPVPAALSDPMQSAVLLSELVS